MFRALVKNIADYSEESKKNLFENPPPSSARSSFMSLRLDPMKNEYIAILHFVLYFLVYH